MRAPCECQLARDPAAPKGEPCPHCGGTVTAGNTRAELRQFVRVTQMRVDGAKRLVAVREGDLAMMGRGERRQHGPRLVRWIEETKYQVEQIEDAIARARSVLGEEDEDE